MRFRLLRRVLSIGFEAGLVKGWRVGVVAGCSLAVVALPVMGGGGTDSKGEREIKIKITSRNEGERGDGAEREGGREIKITSKIKREGVSGSERGYVADDRYRLHAGDKISFQVVEDGETARVLTVTDSGEVEVPYVGRVRAAGKTCREFGEWVKGELEKEYYYRATVVVGLESASRVLGRVYVWGQVRSPGSIELTLEEKMTVGKAVMRAGGFGDFANRKRVKVVRGGPGMEGRKVFELNLVEIMERGRMDKDMELESEDAVIVSARFINF